MLLKCKSGWGLKFCVSHNFQKMSVMLLSALPLSSKCVLKGQAVNSSSEVIMSTECRIQHFQIVWIWTSYVISRSLSSSVKWDKKEWGYSTGLLCRTNEFIHVNVALTTTILLSILLLSWRTAAISHHIYGHPLLHFFNSPTKSTRYILNPLTRS